MSADHKHVYEFVEPVDGRPWWRRVFCEPLPRIHRCSICLLTIDEIIADLEAQEREIRARLDEALAEIPRPHSWDEDEFDGYNEIGAMG